MRHRLVSLILLVSITVCSAEEPVRSTQEELRRRNIFFGDIDGRRSQEYSEAVRRYQQRKGLRASGQEDHETLRSLGLAPKAPGEAPLKELTWPEEPVLRSDARIDVATEAREIAAETGVPTQTIDPVGRGPSSSSRARRARATVSPPATQPIRSVSAPRLSFLDRTAIPANLTEFVSKYLRAVSKNRLEDELAFYADRVDYLGNRQLDRRIIEQTLRSYYQKWPKRSLKLEGPIRLQLIPKRAEIVVMYRVSFALSNGRSKARGQTENRLILNAATADPRIVAIEERRVRN